MPVPENMAEAFGSGESAFATRNPALHFEMSQSHGEFFQSVVRSAPIGNQRVTERIDLVYGAGGGDDVFLTWRDDALYELPVAWLHERHCWGAASWWAIGGFDMSNDGDQARPLTLRCLECHATWFGHSPGSQNKYRREGIMLGVTCERCHGPAREHVAFHDSHPDAREAHAIVNPLRLSRERQLDVCGQCHSNAIKHLGPALQYRPGQPLDASYKTLTIDRSEDDHVANQTQYLRESRCFQQSDTLTCTTCHDPHQARSAETWGRNQAACLKCHAPTDCAERSRLPVDVRDLCVSCHMPQYVKLNVNFLTEDDNYVPPLRRFQHRIGVFPKATQETLLNWHRSQSDEHSRAEALRLTESLTEQWLADAERFRNDHRYVEAIAATREALRLNPTPSLREKLREAVALQSKIDRDYVRARQEINEGHLREAMAILQQILRQQPDSAGAHGQLGLAYAMAGQNQLAVQQLQAVVKSDPNDQYGYSMLGWLAYLRGDNTEAVKYYQQADEIEPRNPKIYDHLGMALAKLERWPEATDRLSRAVDIDPTDVEICHHLSEALRRQGKPEEALPYAKQAVALSGNRDLQLLMSLAENYSEARNYADAAAVAAKALDIAKKSNPEAVGQIQVKRDQYRRLATQRSQ